jgi:hypothetical protein
MSGALCGMAVIIGSTAFPISDETGTSVYPRISHAPQFERSRKLFGSYRRNAYAT